MELIFQIVVFSSLIALGYTWCIYPATVYLLGVRKRDRDLKGSGGNLPSVSVIVAAYNEEKVIADRIENLLAQNYPKENLEIIIASDGSSDRTVEISEKYPAVRVLDFQTNRGRASVHNDSVAAATGMVVLFTDAETIFEKDFLRNAVAYLGDPRYGCGAGDFTFKPLGSMGDTEGAYWRMEKAIRRWEFGAGCLPFASGGCFLIRRDLFAPIAPHSDIDNILPLRVIELGKKVFYAKDAKAYDVTVADSATHFRKRTRTAQRSLTDIWSCLPSLWRAGQYMAIWALLSHRIMRWLTGIFAIAIFTGSLAQATLSQESAIYWQAFFAVQGLIILLVMMGWLRERFSPKWLPLSRLSSLAYSFALANLAFSVAIIKALRGRRITVYQTRSG